MRTALTVLSIFGAGYAAAVFSWDRVHTFIIGAAAKSLQLRDKARALEASLRAKL